VATGALAELLWRTGGLRDPAESAIRAATVDWKALMTAISTSRRRRCRRLLESTPDGSPTAYFPVPHL
jgi:hypothetical protein